MLASIPLRQVTRIFIPDMHSDHTWVLVSLFWELGVGTPGTPLIWPSRHLPPEGAPVRRALRCRHCLPLLLGRPKEGLVVRLLVLVHVLPGTDLDVAAKWVECTSPILTGDSRSTTQDYPNQFGPIRLALTHR